MGTVNSTSITAGSVVNTDIAAGAGIAASKLKHQTVYWIDFGLDDATTPAVDARTFLIADGPGEIISAKAWMVDTGTSSDVDFDLEVGGASVLSAQITVTNATADQTAVAGTISSGTLTAGDYVTAKIATVTSSTGALGPRMQVVINHDYYAG
jgi:hypothetical protein